MRPLVILDGLIQQLSDADRLNVARLNLGPFETIVVTNPTITLSRSFVRVTAPSPTDIETILGGQVGDFVVMFGNNIRFKSTGNLLITNNYKLDGNAGLIWVYTGTVWIPFGA